MHPMDRRCDSVLDGHLRLLHDVCFPSDRASGGQDDLRPARAAPREPGEAPQAQAGTEDEHRQSRGPAERPEHRAALRAAPPGARPLASRDRSSPSPARTSVCPRAAGSSCAAARERSAKGPCACARPAARRSRPRGCAAPWRDPRRRRRGCRAASAAPRSRGSRRDLDRGDLGAGVDVARRLPRSARIHTSRTPRGRRLPPAQARCQAGVAARAQSSRAR